MFYYERWNNIRTYIIIKKEEYNTSSVSSEINVPWGRETWFECHYEGNCNRCGEVLGRNKQMFAF